MPRIRSATYDQFINRSSLREDSGYKHPAQVRGNAIPMAFQVTSPFSDDTLLLPHTLVMHVNPSSMDEKHSKKKEIIQTRGGFVEQHWGDNISEVSNSGSTGAFMNILTGLSSLLRQETIAWDRFRDLLELYRNNGSLYDPFGNIVLQGNIKLIYDRGIFIGTFRDFNVEESADTPFSFNIDFSFKVVKTLLLIPSLFRDGQGAAFQGSNRLVRSKKAIPILWCVHPTKVHGNKVLGQRSSRRRMRSFTSMVRLMSLGALLASVNLIYTSISRRFRLTLVLILRLGLRVFRCLFPATP